MKKLKTATYALSTTLAVAALALGSTLVKADEMDLGTFDYVQLDDMRISPNGQYFDYEELNQQSNFMSFRGIISSINYGVITVEDEESGVMNFLSDDYTFVLGDELAIGDEIEGFYSAFGIAPMIYPPQHIMAAIINHSSLEDSQMIKVDLFFGEDRDESDGHATELTSADNMLTINITDDTVIVDHLGDVHEGMISGRNLIVLYGISTRSIPAITTPDKIIVLPIQGLMPTLPIIGDDQLYEPPSTVFEMPDSPFPIIIHGVYLSGVNFLLEDIDAENFSVSVPLRSVAENLNATIDWNAETAMVTLQTEDKHISFAVGTTEFYVNDEVITLNNPSKLVEGSTFVPLSFFREIFGMNNAYFEGGTVFINQEERMY